MRNMTQALIALALVAGCAGKTQPEPPVRILELDRSVAVLVVSHNEALTVYRVNEDGTRGELLGNPPLEVDRITVGKEIWKSGSSSIPETESPLQRTRVESGEVTRSTETGTPLRWSFWVDDGDSVPVRLDFALPASGLTHAFETGKLELSLDETR